MAKQMRENPWIQMWMRPRETIRSILNTNPKYGFSTLCTVYGLPLALNIAQNLSLINALPIWAIIIGALILAPFIGFIGISISTCLLKWTGRWIGGTASYNSVRAAVAWSNVPNFVTVLMWGVLLAVFDGQVFRRDFAETTFMGYQAGVVFLVFLIQTIISIWAFIMLLVSLSEVQKFSVWRALLNVIIPTVIVIAIIWGLGWVLWGSSSLVK